MGNEEEMVNQIADNIKVHINDFTSASGQGISPQVKKETSEHLARKVEEAKGKVLAQMRQGKINPSQPKEKIAKIAFEKIIQSVKEEIPEVGKETAIGIRQKKIWGPHLAKLFEDTDKDGLSNEEEEKFGTDPLNPDSDGDGYLDGIEVKNGYDPLKPSPGDKIVFQQPIRHGRINLSYSVQQVKLEKKIIEKQGKKVEEKVIKLSGKALPNSFVVLYIYSNPVVITVKADAEGNWSYTLDKDIPNGEHTVYVAVTDNTGKIIEKSLPFVFVKTAQAVAVKELTESEKQLPMAPSPVSSPWKTYGFLTLIVVLVAVLIGVVVISIIARKNSSKQ